MPKRKKGSGEPAEDIQKLYTRAYASRLAKQVSTELESSRRSVTPRKKPTTKS